jgi:hypothetical protein
MGNSGHPRPMPVNTGRSNEPNDFAAPEVPAMYLPQRKARRSRRMPALRRAGSRVGSHDVGRNSSVHKPAVGNGQAL